MKRIERDFVTLFNCLWYKDFPVTKEDDLAGRADWTIHLGVVVRQCASLLGARALFEKGGRTDAVLRYSPDQILSFVEWEWRRAHTDINEIEKLLDRADQAVFQTFIGYSTADKLQAALDRTHAIWENSTTPLICFIITYELNGRDRHFLSLTTYMFSKGRYKKLRSQPALPWMVNRAKFNNASDDT